MNEDLTYAIKRRAIKKSHLINLALLLLAVIIAVGWAANHNTLKNQLRERIAERPSLLQKTRWSRRFTPGLDDSKEVYLLEQELWPDQMRSILVLEVLRCWGRVQPNNRRTLLRHASVLLGALGCEEPDSFRRLLIDVIPNTDIAIDPLNEDYDSFQLFLEKAFSESPLIQADHNPNKRMTMEFERGWE